MARVYLERSFVSYLSPRLPQKQGSHRGGTARHGVAANELRQPLI
jgi:hypothetical protein